MACQNRLIQVLAGDDSTKESTSKRIARTVGIHDLVIREHVDGEDLGLLRLVGSDHHGVLCTLGEHNGAVAGGVALGEKGNGARDAGEVFGVGVAVRAGPRFGFGFVADDDVDVWQDLLQLGVEELDDEWCGKVEHEGLGIFFFLVSPGAEVEDWNRPFQRRMLCCSAREQTQRRVSGSSPRRRSTWRSR